MIKHNAQSALHKPRHVSMNQRTIFKGRTIFSTSKTLKYTEAQLLKCGSSLKMVYLCTETCPGVCKCDCVLCFNTVYQLVLICIVAIYARTLYGQCWIHFIDVYNVKLGGSKYTNPYLNTCPWLGGNAESCDTEWAALSHACAHVAGSSFVLLCNNVTTSARPICHTSRSGSGIHHRNNDMRLGRGDGSFCYPHDCEKNHHFLQITVL
jgi:hypothetical protein